jgi:hypothetical protein
LTFYSACNPPVLFHTGCAHGVHLSEVCSSHTAEFSLSTDLPLLMLVLSEDGADFVTLETTEVTPRSSPLVGRKSCCVPKGAMQGYASTSPGTCIMSRERPKAHTRNTACFPRRSRSRQDGHPGATAHLPLLAHEQFFARGDPASDATHALSGIIGPPRGVSIH